MKTSILILIFAFATFFVQAQEYKIVTSIESVVPMGIGRSRIIQNEEKMDTQNFTTERTDGKKSNQNEVSRKSAKISKFKETKLLNFYSATGINFQNIASNDALITAQINELIMGGWELKFVISGVESDAGAKDGTGIFITRYIFYKP